MSIESPKETGPITDPNDLIEKSRINIKYNKESESIEEITIDSKEGEEIILFPMILDSGQEYMPNIDNDFWSKILVDESEILVNETNTHSIYSCHLGKIEFYIYNTAIGDHFMRPFLEFARYNLSPENYARFLIEQKAIHDHLLLANAKGQISNKKFKEDRFQLIMYWPEYYPGKEEYNMELLPTTKDLYHASLFNKLGHILYNRKQYDTKKQMFKTRELLELEFFINQNHENEPHVKYEPSEIYNKIKEYKRVNSEGIAHMMKYIDLWKEKFLKEFRIECIQDELGDIPIWRKRYSED